MISGRESGSFLEIYPSFFCRHSLTLSQLSLDNISSANNPRQGLFQLFPLAKEEVSITSSKMKLLTRQSGTKEKDCRGFLLRQALASFFRSRQSFFDAAFLLKRLDRLHHCHTRQFLDQLPFFSKIDIETMRIMKTR